MLSSFRHRSKGNGNFNLPFLRKVTMYMMIGFMFMFILTSASSILSSQLSLSSATLKKWTTHVSQETLLFTLGMEIPHLHQFNQSMGMEFPKLPNLIFEMVTSFNPKDPRTLIRSEVPGFSLFDGQIIAGGQGVRYTDIPIESAPPMEVVIAEREATINGGANSAPDPSEGQQGPAVTTEGRKVVLIYHTHNRESWLPHVPSATVPDEAFHSEVNITMVGERLGEELERRGIGAFVDTSDISQKLNDADMPYSLSYAKSREVVETVLAEQKDIQFMFDLHRDALGKDKTTVEIDGEAYARTFFVIGKRNKNYERNLAFAQTFHELLEESYPGLSRGVLPKEIGNGEYNQSLSDHNILIEIGGVENTLEESYRTAEALADVIADLYWEAEKVSTQSTDDM